jgi:probable HAF family extracellular repeat protein
MMKISTRRALLGGALSLICSAAPAATHTYTYTRIAVPNAVQTNPIGINKAGTVLGYWVDEYGNEYGFIYRNATITSFTVPHAVNTRPTGIDDQGDIVGTYQDANYNAHGFTYSAKGVFKTIDLSGSAYTSLDAVSRNGIAVGEGLDNKSNVEVFAYKKGVFTTAVDGNTPIAAAINAQGAIAGTFEAAQTDETAFLYAGGTLTTITIPNVHAAQSYAINNHNAVVGQVTTTQGEELGFLYKNGKVRVFGPAGSADCLFLGINDHDAIAGVSFDSNFNSTGFVYDKGDFSTLTINGANSVGATAINDAGVVIGDYDDAAGPKTFLATPAN